MSKRGRIHTLDTICCSCGNIKVFPFKAHEKRLSREFSTYCYICKGENTHVLISERLQYLSYIDEKEKNNKALTDAEQVAVKFLRRK